MDVFVMPCRSRWAGLEIEGLGIVYLEAASSGLPVLAGDSGGAPETVLPGRSGFVVRSVSDIVEALEMLSRDPERAESMGRAGREFVTETYTWPLVARRIEEAQLFIEAAHACEVRVSETPSAGGGVALERPANA